MKAQLKYHLVVMVLLLVYGCNDETGRLAEPEQDYEYIDLENVRAGYVLPLALDVDQNGESDFIFNTTLVADAIGDHLRFVIISRFSNQVIGVNDDVTALESNDLIGSASAFNHTSELLAVRTVTNGGASWWGHWKEVQSRFVGIRFKLPGSSGYCYGWIRVSLDQSNEQLIIHDMAFSKIAGRSIRAGSF